MTVTDDLLTARTEAIHRSGWGSTFRFVQPRNLAFWVYLALVGWGAVQLVDLIRPGTQIAQRSFAATAAIYAVAAIPFAVFIHQLDRFRSVPGKLATAAFAWGGIAATSAFAVSANDALSGIYSKAGGADFADKWAHALSAPFVEETAKAAGLLLLVALAPRLIRTAFDGLIVGSFLGLGFMVVENMVYGFRGGTNGFDLDNAQGAINTAMFRMATGVFSHWMYSAIFCAGLIWLIGRPDEPRRVGRGLLFIALAMLAHGVWDAASGLSSLSRLLVVVPYLGVPILLIVCYRWIYMHSVLTERRWALAVLQPEVDSGVATQAEVDAFVGTRKHRKAYLRSATGHRGRTGTKHVMEAVPDLLTELCRSGGETTPRVTRARDEVTRVPGPRADPLTGGSPRSEWGVSR